MPSVEIDLGQFLTFVIKKGSSTMFKVDKVFQTDAKTQNASNVHFKILNL